MEPISKSEFKAKALEVLRAIEKSGEARIITDHGKPVAEPVAESDWESA